MPRDRNRDNDGEDLDVPDLDIPERFHARLTEEDLRGTTKRDQRFILKVAECQAGLEWCIEEQKTQRGYTQRQRNVLLGIRDELASLRDQVKPLKDAWSFGQKLVLAAACAASSAGGVALWKLLTRSQ